MQPDVLRILDADIEELTRTGVEPVRAPEAASGWRLPEGARNALRRHGLPPSRDDGLLCPSGSFGPGDLPELEVDGRRLYAIGVHGDAVIGATEGEGVVLALPKHREVHPDLRHLYPSGLRPVLVNSTVEYLVECAWRWYWLVPLMVEQQEAAGRAEVEAFRSGTTGPDAPDFYASYQQLCNHVHDRFHAVDPAVGSTAPFWAEVVLDVW